MFEQKIAVPHAGRWSAGSVGLKEAVGHVGRVQSPVRHWSVSMIKRCYEGRLRYDFAKPF